MRAGGEWGLGLPWSRRAPLPIRMLRKPITRPLLAMAGSLLALLSAAAWGASFGFPEPDASPEKSAHLAFHASVAGWSMLVAGGAFVASCVVFLRALRSAGKHSVP